MACSVFLSMTVKAVTRNLPVAVLLDDGTRAGTHLKRSHRLVCHVRCHVPVLYQSTGMQISLEKHMQPVYWELTACSSAKGDR